MPDPAPPPSPSALIERFPALFGHGLQPEDIDVSALLGIRQVAVDQRVLRCGDLTDTLYLVWKGRLRVEVLMSDGRTVLGEVGPGRWVGELGFIDPGPAEANVVVVETAILLALSHRDLLRLETEAPAVARALLHGIIDDLSDRVRDSGRAIWSRDPDGARRLQMPEDEQHGWLSETWHRLFGGGRGA